MEKIREKFEKFLGYKLDDYEILIMYRNGDILLTDKQEDEIIKYFNL